MPRRYTPGMYGEKPPKGQHGGPRQQYLQKEDLRLKLYVPHDGQKELHMSKARFRIAVAGRRWGKTIGCVNELAKYGWEHPQLPSWWVAPTYSQAVKAFTTAEDNFASAIKSKRAAQGQMMIVWKSGGRTRFLSAERYENLRGEGVGFMVVDEAAFVARAAWEQVLRPMLSDTMGRAILISTPRGKNWFHQMYLRGLDEAEPEYDSFWFPTISSPYVADSEVEEAKRTLPADVFAQEYEAAFLDEAAGVFHNIESCIWGEYEDYDSTHRYAIGWDLAKHSDFSVISVMDTDHIRVEQNAEGKTVQLPAPHLAHWERFNTLSYATQMEKVEALARRYNAYVLMDTTGLGDPIYDTLQARGVPVYPFHMSSNRKAAIIQNLAVTIETRGITFPGNPVLEHELSAYQYEISPAGTLRYSAPEGDHDDTVISLALGVWAAQHPVWMAEPQISYVNEEVISPI